MTRRLIREGDPPSGQLASPVPQYWNPSTEAFEDVLGAHGAPRAILYGLNGQPISQSNPLEVRVRELEAELAAMRGMLETGNAKVTLSGSVASNLEHGGSEAVLSSLQGTFSSDDGTKAVVSWPVGTAVEIMGLEFAAGGSGSFINSVELLIRGRNAQGNLVRFPLVTKEGTSANGSMTIGRVNSDKHCWFETLVFDTGVGNYKIGLRPGARIVLPNGGGVEIVNQSSTPAELACAVFWRRLDS